MEADTSSREWGLARIGQYLESFAKAEQTVDAAIGAALRLTGDQTLIVTAELFIGTKIKIAHAAILSSKILPPLQGPYIDALKALAEIASTDRVIIAHGYFSPSPHERKVTFRKSRLPKGIKTTEVAWGETEFRQKIDKLDRVTETLSPLPQHVRNVDIADILLSMDDRPKGLAGGLFGGSAPTGGLYGLGLLGLLGQPPPPESQRADLPDATHQTWPKTLEGHDEKN
jgi:hypothetical protein